MLSEADLDRLSSRMKEGVTDETTYNAIVMDLGKTVEQQARQFFGGDPGSIELFSRKILQNIPPFIAKCHGKKNPTQWVPIVNELARIIVRECATSTSPALIMLCYEAISELVNFDENNFPGLPEAQMTQFRDFIVETEVMADPPLARFIVPFLLLSFGSDALCYGPCVCVFHKFTEYLTSLDQSALRNLDDGHMEIAVMWATRMILAHPYVHDLLADLLNALKACLGTGNLLIVFLKTVHGSRESVRASIYKRYRKIIFDMLRDTQQNHVFMEKVVKYLPELILEGSDVSLAMDLVKDAHAPQLKDFFDEVASIICRYQTAGNYEHVFILCSLSGYPCTPSMINFWGRMAIACFSNAKMNDLTNDACVMLLGSPLTSKEVMSALFSSLETCLSALYSNPGVLTQSSIDLCFTVLEKALALLRTSKAIDKHILSNLNLLHITNCLNLLKQLTACPGDVEGCASILSKSDIIRTTRSILQNLLASRDCVDSVILSFVNAYMTCVLSTKTTQAKPDDLCDDLINVLIKSPSESMVEDIAQSLVFLCGTISYIPKPTALLVSHIMKRFKSSEITELQQKYIIIALWKLVKTFEANIELEDVGPNFRRHKLPKRQDTNAMTFDLWYEQKAHPITMPPFSPVRDLKLRAALRLRSTVRNIQLSFLDQTLDDDTADLAGLGMVPGSVVSVTKLGGDEECDLPSYVLWQKGMCDLLLDICRKSPKEDLTRWAWRLVKILPISSTCLEYLSNVHGFYKDIKNENSDYVLTYMLQFREVYAKTWTEFAARMEEWADLPQALSSKIGKLRRAVPYICGLLDNYYSFRDSLFAKNIADPLMERMSEIDREKVFFVERATSLISKLAQSNASEITVKNYSRSISLAIQKTDSVKWNHLFEMLQKMTDQQYLWDLCVKQLQENAPNMEYFARVIQDIFYKGRASPGDVGVLMDLLLSKTEEYENRAATKVTVRLICDLIRKYPERFATGEIIRRLLRIQFCHDNYETLEGAYQIIKQNQSSQLYREFLEILANVNFGPEWNYDVTRTTKGQFVGIQNHGTTCFVNCIFQELFFFKPFTSLLLKTKTDDKAMQCLQNIFARLLMSDRKGVETRPFLDAWKGWDNNLIPRGRQQDANEFFELLVDSLPKSLSSLFMGEVTVRFEGEFVNYTSTRTEEIVSLSVSVKGFSCLAESFDKWLATESVVEGYNTGRPEIGSIDARRYQRISKAPQVLVLRLERFDYNRETMRKEKLYDKFVYPETVNLTRLMEDEHCDTRYRLHGVVTHYGNGEQGHYSAIVRDRSTNHWIRISDLNMEDLGPNLREETFGGIGVYREDYPDGIGEAYLLFYVKEDIVIEDTYDDLNKEIVDAIAKDNCAYAAAQTAFRSETFSFVMSLDDMHVRLVYFFTILPHVLKCKWQTDPNSLARSILATANYDMIFDYIIDNYPVVESVLENVRDTENIFSRFISDAIRGSPSIEKPKIIIQKVADSLKTLAPYAKVHVILRLLELCIDSRRDLRDELNSDNIIKTVSDMIYLASLENEGQLLQTWDLREAFGIFISLMNEQTSDDSLKGVFSVAEPLVSNQRHEESFVCFLSRAAGYGKLDMARCQELMVLMDTQINYAQFFNAILTMFDRADEDEVMRQLKRIENLDDNDRRMFWSLLESSVSSKIIWPLFLRAVTTDNAIWSQKSVQLLNNYFARPNSVKDANCLYSKIVKYDFGEHAKYQIIAEFLFKIVPLIEIYDSDGCDFVIHILTKLHPIPERSCDFLERYPDDVLRPALSSLGKDDSIDSLCLFWRLVQNGDDELIRKTVTLDQIKNWLKRVTETFVPDYAINALLRISRVFPREEILACISTPNFLTLYLQPYLTNFSPPGVERWSEFPEATKVQMFQKLLESSLSVIDSDLANYFAACPRVHEIFKAHVRDRLRHWNKSCEALIYALAQANSTFADDACSYLSRETVNSDAIILGLKIMLLFDSEKCARSLASALKNGMKSPKVLSDMYDFLNANLEKETGWLAPVTIEAVPYANLSVRGAQDFFAYGIRHLTEEQVEALNAKVQSPSCREFISMARQELVK